MIGKDFLSEENSGLAEEMTASEAGAVSQSSKYLVSGSSLGVWEFVVDVGV
jgi:hypothetical protein